MANLDIQLLRSSFDALKPYAGEVIQHFYDHLVKSHPEVLALFHGQITSGQHKSLITSLSFIVDHVDKPEKLGPYLKSMGARHGNYGVQAHHYKWVATSLLATLEHYFDDTWSAELRETWSEALNAVSGAMIEAQGVNEKSASATPLVIEQIEAALKEVILKTLEDLTADHEVIKIARAKARALIQSELDRELNDLRSGRLGRKAS